MNEMTVKKCVKNKNRVVVKFVVVDCNETVLPIIFHYDLYYSIDEFVDCSIALIYTTAFFMEYIMQIVIF